MCIMIGKIIGVSLPTVEAMDNCYRLNKDGCGIAWTSGDGTINIKKDFDDHEAFKTWVRANINESHSAILHYRLATSGLSDCGNRHPFPITKDRGELRKVETTCDVAVAHNGVFRSLGDKKYSDTQEFIVNILADPVIKANLHTEALQALILNYLDTSKLIFLHGNGMIWRYGTFEEDTGLFYSNVQFKGWGKIDYSDGYNSWGTWKGRHWDKTENKWVDDKPESSKQIECLAQCIHCKVFVAEKKLFLVWSDFWKRLETNKMCGKCYYKDGQNKLYTLYNPKVNAEHKEYHDRFAKN